MNSWWRNQWYLLSNRSEELQFPMLSVKSQMFDYHCCWGKKHSQLVCFSLNQPQSCWAALIPGGSDRAPASQSGRETCFVGTFTCGEVSTVINWINWNSSVGRALAWQLVTYPARDSLQTWQMSQLCPMHCMGQIVSPIAMATNAFISASMTTTTAYDLS